VESGGPKLLDRVRDTIRTRHYSRRTEEAYVHWIRRYIVFHHKAHPSTMGTPEIWRDSRVSVVLSRGEIVSTAPD
jgi:hypothetical protein